MSNKALAYSILVVVLLATGVFVFLRLKSNRVEFKGETANSTPGVAETDKQPVLAETPEVKPVAVKSEIINGCERKFDPEMLKNNKVNLAGKRVEVSVKGYGKFVVAFDEKVAPKTVENFLKLTESGFYDCLTFHRLAKGFVVQGGDPLGTGQGGPGYTVPAEIGLKHKKGSIAMARLGDNVNPKRDSSGSQFYIALQDLPQLDDQYTVFGEVISGMDVVEKIGSAPVLGNASDGSPQTPIIMESVKIVK